jgi:hypothetical protein
LKTNSSLSGRPPPPPRRRGPPAVDHRSRQIILDDVENIQGGTGLARELHGSLEGDARTPREIVGYHYPSYHPSPTPTPGHEP